MKFVNLNDMYAFTKVAENKSITLASRAMNTSKQTISRKIVQLEESLGVALILRDTRNFELTSAGSEYYENCIRIFEQAEMANIKVKEFQNSPVGEVRVSMPRIFNCKSVSNIFSGFLNHNPELKLDIKMSDRRVCLVNDSVDAVIRIGPLQDSSLIARQLGKVHLSFVASPEYIKKHGRPRTLEDIVSHTLIGIQGCNALPDLKENMKGKKVMVNDFSMSKQFVLNNAGISLLPLFLCTEEIRSGRLVGLDDDCFRRSVDVNLMFLKSKYIPGYVRRFIDYMIETCKSGAPWDCSLEDLNSDTFDATSIAQRKKSLESHNACY